MPAPPDGSTPPGEPTPAVASTSGGVELGRVLSLARITAPQALVLTEDLRAALAEGGGAGRPLLTGDGRITLGPAADGPATRPAERFLDDLAALLPDEPVMDVDRAAVRSELAALARAVRALPDGAGAAPPAPARRAAVRDRPAPRPPRRPRSTGRRIGAWLLSLVVLGAAVTAEVVLLGDDITADLDLLMDAGRGGQEPSDEPVPDGLPVATPAPPSAGAVVAVDLRPLGTCTPGATCAVRVLVRLVPSPEQQVVSWSYRVVDRCTGTSTPVPGGSVTVPPQADRTAVVAEVALPPLAGAALIAVTEEPAVAASDPVVLGSCRPAGHGA
ncbi:hypothetical protein JKP75_10025 [Blastococcus sp. TML/M2B]|uniref:hypothetical protein n=1 Tax=Blastococcus sp. TML/M2B TaxID=2798727 RepID=UPI0019095E94|nr:hypothetical protein [Blastococcus sp. TML/M2B]MBN1092866.1 hypothetical protein [Blastococcus sp. TML/M2B]